MEARDRLANLGILVAAGIAWILVAAVVTTRDPVLEPGSGFVGAGLMGLALGLTTIPLFWLIVFGRHRRIAYRGDWTRAVRRGAWVGLLVTVVVLLRLQEIPVLPMAVFMVALVLVAEATLSAEH
jgi:hypothetical protein